jgi:mRNA-degrading endonuclease RelE of RelBE toxin-antitoxin system
MLVLEGVRMNEQNDQVQLHQGARASLRFLTVDEAEKVSFALEELRKSGDPARLPNVKRSPTGDNVYTMPVGEDRRLLFEVEPSSRRVVVLGLYGNDQITALARRQAHTA